MTIYFIMDSAPSFRDKVLMFDMSSGEEFRDQLREWREDNSRHSDEIIQYWEEGLELGVETFGDEKWMVVEQVTVAAMDMNRADIVHQCLLKLIEKFGASSLRIRRLQAMRLEMVERWDEAIEVLDSILEEDVANSSARKRKIAIYKSQGETDRAVRELVKYLGVFMSDQEAWMELCELYTSEQDYSKVIQVIYSIRDIVFHLSMFSGFLLHGGAAAAQSSQPPVSPEKR